jgi:adenine-specific DNA methylase
MLQNGLGEIIGRTTQSTKGFADLFTGSGTVAWHVSEKFDVPVRAFDLQSFAVALADGVIGRNAPFDELNWVNLWLESAISLAAQSPIWESSLKIDHRLPKEDLEKVVAAARRLAARSEHSFCRAYGGYYYSPRQATLLAALRASLPTEPAQRKLSLAALIATGSRCAASPGHTAQPFRPTTTAGPYLIEAWQKRPVDVLTVKVKELAARHARQQGIVCVDDAASAASKLTEGWIAFVDPPYSSVHYSRFYHVLESLSRGDVGEVSGSGRYPVPSERPSSDFSVSTKARAAFETLFSKLSNSGARAIVTFPADGASNGITGEVLRELAEQYFKIVEEKVSSRFSTLGGNRNQRDARKDAVELILSLDPR